MAKRRTQTQLSFAAAGEKCACGRCGAPCTVDPVPGSQATMLKKADVPKGLCINCAVHNTLRHLYPANLILERSAGKGLLHPHIQKEFFGIAQSHKTDARFEEINWGAIVANWDLPFPTPLKRTGTNPVRPEELAMARLEGEQRRAGTYKEPMTEEEYQAQRQDAIEHFLRIARKESCEDPPPDHRDGG